MDLWSTMLDGDYLTNIGLLVPISSFLLVLALTMARIYFSIRRRFPIRVNCWFCNRNDRVPYDQRNSFVCAGCLQYNGFGVDGGYNREIPEQHYAKLNPVTNSCFSEENVYDLRTGNGLCYSCNRNQELKILQLAAFVPENEANFAAEVDAYKENLERSYRLCARCERVVKRSINKVKTRIVTTTRPLTTEIPKKQKTTKILLWLSLILAAVNIFSILQTFSIGKTTLDGWLGETLADFCVRIVAYVLAVKAIMTKYLVENSIWQATALYWETPVGILSSTFETERGFHDLKEILTISGTLATVMLIVMSEGKRLGLFSGLLLLWSFSTLLHNHKLVIEPINIDTVAILELLGCFVTFYLTYTAFNSSPTFKESNLNRSFHKICTQVDDESDESEESPFHSPHRDTILNSTFNSASPSKNLRSSLNASDIMSVISKKNNFMDLTSAASVYSNAQSTLRQRPNPFLSHLNLDCPSPTPRTSLISPSTFNADLASERSWVGGGFWTTTSPVKKRPQPPVAINNEFIPILSRTSSQSSGFESQMQMSRENSVTKEFEVASVFSEPVLKPQPLYPASTSRFASPVQRNFLGDTFFSSSSRSRNATDHQSRSLYNASTAADHQWRRPQNRGSIFNFKKFKTDLPQL